MPNILNRRDLDFMLYDLLDAEALTGLQVGGISALALINRGFDVCLDRAAQGLERVTVSAGKRGINLCLAVSDLVRITGARWVDATGERGASPPARRAAIAGRAASSSAGSSGGGNVIRLASSPYSASSRSAISA